MNQPKRAGYALKQGEGLQIKFRSTVMTVKAAGDQTDGAYSFIEMDHPAGVGPALHIHPGGAEAFYVLEGSYTIRCDRAVYQAGPGDFVFIPTGTPHNYQTGPNGGKVLVLAPAGLERYFSGVVEILAVGDITWEQEKAIAAQYGQEFIDNMHHWGQ